MRKNLLKYIENLGFSPKTGDASVWYKIYNGYEIAIQYNEEDPTASFINYGKNIKQGRKTTSDFRQAESFVVLECVNRLLEKGYKPESIELEKSWNLGHKGKGFLDILVKDSRGQSFLMIECKVWGKDFEAEINNTLNKSKKGSQIFSYLQQEPKTTRAVALYTFNPDTQEYKTAIVYNHKEWAELNQEDRYNRWLRKFEDNGIFEDWVSAYSLQSKAITKKDLKPLTKEDGDNIYNKFAEILRHNVVSDKSNAFNKIINLFLCKIYDEDKEEDEELKFQTRRGTEIKSDEDLLLDLSDLYLKGMQKFLGKEIEDLTLDEFNNILTLTNNREELQNIYRQLRLYKDNVFGFREVFDKKSFSDNAKIVREVVELLQDKKLRYSHKQQFLGDFFENLLKDSIKQESGQFFTPVPITQFIINSLPIHEIIYNNIASKADNILPYTIDYAMGAGHFLTEIMDEYNNIIKGIDVIKISKPTTRVDVEIWKIKEFAWAEQYVYGIDLDYRLVKTSKIACFLNGDGLANVIHADGLDSFKKSNSYKEKLLVTKNSIDNEQFDVLISNPPYSVKAFKNTVNDGENSFELFKYLTDNSSEIECLFVERAKQLLKPGAVIAIILPISILTNNGIYEKAREILLKHFEFKAILSLGMQAFAATNTKTVVLFMKKRPNFVFSEMSTAVENFFTNHKEVAINGIPKPIQCYINNNYTDISVEDYVDLLNNNITDKVKSSEIYKEYKFLSNADIVKLEKDKLLYFVLTYPQKIVLATSKDKDEEKAFYGYEFSSRRGHEGIQIYRNEENVIETKLFDPNERKNTNKLNYYILNNYNNVNIADDIEDIKSDEEHPLNGHIDFVSLSSLLSFDSKMFDKAININTKKKIKIESKYPLERLQNIIDVLETGSRDSKIGTQRLKSGVPSLGGEHIGLNGKVSFDNMRYITEDSFQKMKSGKIKKEDILLCKDGALTGKVAFVDNSYPYVQSAINEHVFIIRTDKNKVEQKFLFDLLFSAKGQQQLKSAVSGAAQGGLSRTNLLNLQVPVPPLKIQQEIVEKIEKLNNLQQKSLEQLDLLQGQILETFSTKTNTNKFKLGDLLSLEYGVPLPKQKRRSGEFPVVGANGIIGYHNKFLIEGPSIIVGRKGSVGKVNKIAHNNTPIDTTYYVTLKNNEILFDYAYHLLKSLNLEHLNRGIGSGGLNRNHAYSLSVELPDLQQQLEIVRKISILEHKIDSINQEISSVEQQKQHILDSYLK